VLNRVDDNSMEGDWEAQLADYALGVMEPAAAAEFERRLAECRSHVALSDQYSGVIGLLGFATGPAEPPGGHKDRFIARLGATPQEAGAGAAVEPVLSRTPSQLVQEPLAPVPVQPVGAGVSGGTTGGVVDLAGYRERRRAQYAYPMTAVAAMLLLFVTGWGWYQAEEQKGQVEAEARRQAAAAAVMQTDLNRLQQEANELKWSFVVPTDTVMFPLAGHGEEADAVAVGAMDPKDNKVYLVADGLGALPAGEVYEMWLIPRSPSGGKPVAAGVFKVDESGLAKHIHPAPEPLSSFGVVAVTIEPAPGVTETRTGNVVLTGTVASSR
jgi:anti-sigma-K factor RskA